MSYTFDARKFGHVSRFRFKFVEVARVFRSENSGEMQKKIGINVKFIQSITCFSLETNTDKFKKKKTIVVPRKLSGHQNSKDSIHEYEIWLISELSQSIKR